MASVDLGVVGDNNALCTGATATLQCTLMGNVLTWNTPEGALNFDHGFQSEPNAGSYHGQLIELNATHQKSILTFTFTTEITINCSDTTTSNSVTLVVEGMASRRAYLHIAGSTCRSPECTRSATDSPGQDQETEQDSLLSVCGVEHS